MPKIMSSGDGITLFDGSLRVPQNHFLIHECLVPVLTFIYKMNECYYGFLLSSNPTPPSPLLKPSFKLAFCANVHII
jgi:hypothetical protein